MRCVVCFVGFKWRMLWLCVMCCVLAISCLMCDTRCWLLAICLFYVVCLLVVVCRSLCALCIGGVVGLVVCVVCCMMCVG